MNKFNFTSFLALFFLSTLTHAASINVTVNDTQGIFNKAVEFDAKSRLLQQESVTFRQGDTNIKVTFNIRSTLQDGEIFVGGLVTRTENLESEHLKNTPLSGKHDKTRYEHGFHTILKPLETKEVTSYNRELTNKDGKIIHKENFSVTFHYLK